ncbi:MAG: flagellar biosynthesis anti-sigma factor FlgM [Planctomycetales bacterium]|nr:flagellar biosynthesis anti-sigma factor FlgM [bacterium]UNM09084.1 MAG: flagellar biosynthesis anti-sigma factor FlgM [Planctomycetales bacterium]
MRIPDIKGMISLAKDLHESPTRVPAQRSAAPQRPGDSIELSSQGQQVQKLTAQRSDQSQRASMVAALKSQFERGEMKLDQQATAEAMVSEGIFDDLI